MKSLLLIFSLSFLSSAAVAGPIHDAAKKGNLQEVQRLINEGVDVDAGDKEGRTALHWAVHKQNTKLTKFLVESGADVNIEDNYGRSAFHLASQTSELGYTKALARFLNKYIKKMDRENMKEAIHEAAEAGNLQEVQLLINEGVDINAVDKHGWTPLHVAVHKQNVMLTKFLVANGADVNIEDNYGRSAFYLASQTSSLSMQVELTKLLIDKVVFVDTKKNKEMWREEAIRFADEYRSAEVVLKILLENRGDKIRNTKEEVIRFTQNLKSRSTKNFKSLLEKKSSPIHDAAEAGNLQEVQRLINEGVDINAVDKHGWTPLHWAVHKQNMKLTKFLFESGADVNIEDNYGRSAFYWASQTSELGYTKALARFLNKYIKNENKVYRENTKEEVIRFDRKSGWTSGGKSLNFKSRSKKRTDGGFKSACSGTF